MNKKDIEKFLGFLGELEANGELKDNSLEREFSRLFNKIFNLIKETGDTKLENLLIEFEGLNVSFIEKIKKDYFLYGSIGRNVCEGCVLEDLKAGDLSWVLKIIKN